MLNNKDMEIKLNIEEDIKIPVVVFEPQGQ
jgi:hypothetical protein